MEIKDINIQSIEPLIETQFHALTDNGKQFFDINEITFNGKKYNDINVLASDLNVIINTKTNEELNNLKAEELRKYDDWFIRKIRKGIEVPIEVIEACNEIDERYFKLGLNSSYKKETATERKTQPAEPEPIKTEPIKETLILNTMQTHENTNVVKPTMIGKKPVYKSKKYQLNILDYIKGFIVSILSAMLFAVQQMADSGTLQVTNYKSIVMAAISAAIGYLLKNLFTDNSKK